MDKVEQMFDTMTIAASGNCLEITRTIDPDALGEEFEVWYSPISLMLW